MATPGESESSTPSNEHSAYESKLYELYTTSNQEYNKTILTIATSAGYIL